MREPLPFITGSGAVFAIFLTLYLLLSGIVDPTIHSLSRDQWPVLIGAFAVIVGPIFNLIFHPIWVKFFNGYQSFGYQRTLLQKYNRDVVAAAYFKAVYIGNNNKKVSDAIEFARRFVYAYLSHLQFRWAIAVSVFLLWLAIGTPTRELNVITLVSATVFFLSYLFTERTGRDLEIFEKNLLDKKVEELIEKGVI